MRGKAIDTEYVADFIQECAVINKISPEEICEEALRRIEEIDQQLKLRLKLADVLSFFSYRKVSPEIKEEKTQTYNHISQSVSIKILDLIAKNGCLAIQDITTQSQNDQEKKELVFTLKQMLEANVVYRNSANVIANGENYKNYVEQIGKDNKEQNMVSDIKKD